MTRPTLLLAVACALCGGRGGTADPPTADALPAELRALAEPPDPAATKDLDEDEVKELGKKRAERALRLLREFEAGRPPAAARDAARSLALKAAGGVDDGDVVAAASEVARALKADATKGSDLAAQAELYLLGRQLHTALKGAESVADFRAAWARHEEAIRAKATAYLAEYPKYRPGADAVATLIPMAETAGDSKTPDVVREAIAKNFPDHPAARELARAKAVGKEFDFTFTPSGAEKATSLKDLRGKVVVVSFWASWSVPCRPEQSRLRKLYDKHHAEGLEVVGVSLDDKEKAAARFLKKHHAPWPQVVGKEARKLGDDWAVEHVPAQFVVDRKGRLRSVDALGKLDELLPALLAEKE